MSQYILTSNTANPLRVKSLKPTFLAATPIVFTYSISCWRACHCLLNCMHNPRPAFPTSIFVPSLCAIKHQACSTFKLTCFSTSTLHTKLRLPFLVRPPLNLHQAHFPKLSILSGTKRTKRVCFLNQRVLCNNNVVSKPCPIHAGRKHSIHIVKTTCRMR